MVRLLALRKYRGRLSYLPAPARPSGSAGGAAGGAAAASEAPVAEQPPWYWNGVHGAAPGAGGGGDGAAVRRLPKLTDPVPSDWVTVEDTFWCVATIRR